MSEEQIEHPAPQMPSAPVTNPVPADLPVAALPPADIVSPSPSPAPTPAPAPVPTAAPVVVAAPATASATAEPGKTYKRRTYKNRRGGRGKGRGGGTRGPRASEEPRGNGDVGGIDEEWPITNAEDVESPPGLGSEVLDAVVKVYATHCDPNYSLPWQMRRQTQSTSSGFVIPGRYILTNAHSVEHFTVVKVKKRGSDHKFIAKVLAIGNECDIALMTVSDDDFWQGLQPLSFGELPELQASVIVVGYPIGGENISVTAGVVSRVEIQEYTHGASQLLGIQIDAAINSGSSGGPALNHRNQVVGIAFQSLNTGDTENIGYLVAESVVKHFLDDYKINGKYTGFCYCGFQWQRMENIYLRRSMGMQDDENGILVRRVDKTSQAPKVLREGDIITHIDGVEVSNAGTVPYRSGERISFHYIITQKFTGETVELRIIRKGEKKQVKYALGEITKSHLVPVHDQRRQPEYFTVAGLVFVAISEPYLSAEWGEKWDLKAPVKLLDKWMHGYKETEDEQVVVLSQVLNAEINIGYEYVTNTTVHRFNGTKIRNLAQLAELVDACQDEYLRFDLDHDEVVVVSRKEAMECSAEILATHCIPAPHSIGPLGAPTAPSYKNHRHKKGGGRRKGGGPQGHDNRRKPKGKRLGHAHHHNAMNNGNGSAPTHAPVPVSVPVRESSAPPPSTEAPECTTTAPEVVVNGIPPAVKENLAPKANDAEPTTPTTTQPVSQGDAPAMTGTTLPPSKDDN